MDEGKISAQPHPTLCIQFLNIENNDKNNTFPLGKQIFFTIVWGCAETLTYPLRTFNILYAVFTLSLQLRIFTERGTCP